jgi:son of sevenless-like protein
MSIFTLQQFQRIPLQTFTIPKVPTTISPKKARKSKAHKNDLLKLDPVDIAEQLALLEFSLFIKITPQECLTYAKIQSGEPVARLQDFCNTHDKLGSWVKNSILTNSILGKRADTVDFWVKVAEVCFPKF